MNSKGLDYRVGAGPNDAGLLTLRWLLLAWLAFVPKLSAEPQNVAVVTYHNDIARTGRNTNESILTPANVGSANFRKLGMAPVDGYIFGQPLVATNVTVPNQGVHNLLIVISQHDSVYAFDADNFTSSNTVPLWQVSFINPAAGITTIPSAEVGSPPIGPEVGITSTPVIEPETGTLFVASRTRVVSGGKTNYLHHLHALQLGTGQEKSNSPVLIQASIPGTGEGSVSNVLAFDPLRQNNRSALLLSKGVVYIAFASLVDLSPYHGWVIGYDAATLAQTGVFNANPNGEKAGIWMAGNGPAADPEGNIYVSTSNGTFDGLTNNNFGDSLIKLSTTNGPKFADYFTPRNQSVMDITDNDFGSGGITLIPDEAGSPAHPHLLVCGDKMGNIYLVDRDNLGQFNPPADLVVQEIYSNSLKFASTPVYFNHTIYYIGVRDNLKAYSLSNAVMGARIVTNSLTAYIPNGATPSLSSSGRSNAVLWAIQNSVGVSVLHAYDAANIAAPDLYNSNTAGQNAGAIMRFTPPTVANGKVYVPVVSNIAVYGLSSPIITNQPSPWSIGAGSNITFSVGVNSTGAVNYRWRKNLVTIPNATNQTLTLANVQAADVASYSAVVTDSIGMAVSVEVGLNITNLPSTTGTNDVVEIEHLGPGTNRLTFVGQTNQQYVVLWSTNLAGSPWLPLSTNQTGTNAYWQIIDDKATNPIRFYRSVFP